MYTCSLYSTDDESNSCQLRFHMHIGQFKPRGRASAVARRALPSQKAFASQGDVCRYRGSVFSVAGGRLPSQGADCCYRGAFANA